MISGTKSDCKVKSITVSESTATITLLVFASKDTDVPKPFCIYLKDENGVEKIRLDNKTYWIDKINNFNSDSNNVSVNKYKEIILDVDITNSNKSSISDNHWVRSCYIVFMDASSNSQVPIWSSGKLTLISEQFEVPEIKELSFFTTELEQSEEYDGILSYINTRIRLSYNKTKKVSYNNKNVRACMCIRSIATKKVLEKKYFELSDEEENIFKSNNKYQFGEPVIVDIYIENVSGSPIYSASKIYRPYRKYSNAFIKTLNGVKRVKAFYVNLEVGSYNDQDRQHEGDWL